MNAITIREAALEAGINRNALRERLVRAGVEPVERRWRGNLYRRDEIMQLALMPIQHERKKRRKKPPQETDHIGATCSRCGSHDYGNKCRGGLCLDCYCHDYCKERGI